MSRKYQPFLSPSWSERQPDENFDDYKHRRRRTANHLRFRATKWMSVNDPNRKLGKQRTYN